MRSLLLALCLAQGTPAPPDPVYSGPQVGERVPPFLAIDVTGGRKERTFDPTKEAGDGLVVYAMFTGPARPVTRSLANLDCITREINAVAAREKRSGVKVFYVLLAPDRIEGAARLRHIWLGILPAAPATLAAEGIEGPGNWGLNRRCQLTVVVAKAGQVVFNVTTTTPGDREDDAIRAALSDMFGHACTSRPNWARSGEMPMAGGMKGEMKGAMTGGMTGGMTGEPMNGAASRPASRPARM